MRPVIATAAAERPPGSYALINQSGEKTGIDREIAFSTSSLPQAGLAEYLKHAAMSAICGDFGNVYRKHLGP
jgi:hypothetical protein